MAFLYQGFRLCVKLYDDDNILDRIYSFFVSKKGYILQAWGFLKRSLIVFGGLCTLVSCAYRFGSPERRIPGGYELVSVPVFKNKSQEVSVENIFTQAFRKEVERSSLAKIVSKSDSQAIVEGEITSVQYIAGSEVTRGDSGYEDLPSGVVLSKEYRIYITTQITLKRSSDLAVLWTGTFTGERRYSAPAITKQVISTANPIYNQSARIEHIQLIAEDTMTQAFEQLTENF